MIGALIAKSKVTSRSKKSLHQLPVLFRPCRIKDRQNDMP